MTAVGPHPGLGCEDAACTEPHPETIDPPDGFPRVGDVVAYVGTAGDTDSVWAARRLEGDVYKVIEAIYSPPGRWFPASYSLKVAHPVTGDWFVCPPESLQAAEGRQA